MNRGYQAQRAIPITLGVRKYVRQHIRREEAFAQPSIIDAPAAIDIIHKVDILCTSSNSS
jgi:hypothetical protein